ncbi:uncharacterized protein G2W53_039267 [Senna tora]|uniref:Uncharacterized protein n=1 Tax=Senna tora TaxID=362788 RepID=A0A834SPB4_9FABA|nr:uncharacterized protein G2W53_039267 [Senna tora]
MRRLVPLRGLRMRIKGSDVSESCEGALLVPCRSARRRDSNATLLGERKVVYSSSPSFDFAGKMKVYESKLNGVAELRRFWDSVLASHPGSDMYGIAGDDRGPQYTEADIANQMSRHLKDVKGLSVVFEVVDAMPDPLVGEGDLPEGDSVVPFTSLCRLAADDVNPPPVSDGLGLYKKEGCVALRSFVEKVVSNADMKKLSSTLDQVGTPVNSELACTQLLQITTAHFELSTRAPFFRVRDLLDGQLEVRSGLAAPIRKVVETEEETKAKVQEEIQAKVEEEVQAKDS